MTRQLGTTALFAWTLALFACVCSAQSPARIGEIVRLPPVESVSPTYVAARLGGPRSFPPSTVPTQEVCKGCSKSQCACTRWILSADALWMSRSRANSQTMIESPLGGLVISESFNANELTSNARAGYRLTWGYDLQDGRAFEISAMNVYDQPAHADVADTDMFFTFHNLSPATATNSYTIDYVSNLHSGEMNWWLAEKWGIRPMIGARWIRVREEFSIRDATGTSWNALSHVKNDLVGGQIGFKTRVWNGGNWFRLEAGMKSGVYHNNVEYLADVGDEFGVLQGSMIRTPSSTSFVGELTVAAVVQCSPHVALRFGYQGLWMSDLALAPNQANRSDIVTGAGTSHFGGLNYQGGFVGLEANW